MIDLTKLFHISYLQSNPIDMDTEGAIGSVYLTEVSISSRSCDKSQKYTFLSKYSRITPNIFKHRYVLILQTVSMKTHGSLEKINQKLCNIYQLD